MGGGGGAGSSNNATGTPGFGAASSGAAGGGLVFVRAGTVTGSGTINANGTNANNSVTNDASGGGGGGGQALVFVNNSGGATGVTINANGGAGGTNTGGGSPHGPGGGGSGGFAIVSGSTTINVAGGANGTTATSPTSTAAYGSTSSPGGSLTVSLGATQIPGISPNASCLPRLTVTKTTSTPSAIATGTATYSITVSNQNGYGTATGVTITDPLTPSNPFTFASTTSITLAGGATRPTSTNPAAAATAPAWGSFTIPGGGSVTITFVVNVPGATPTGTYQNPANVTYDDPTRTSAGQTVTPGGVYAGGGTVPGANYVAASTSNEDVIVRTPFTGTKSFVPASISANGISVLTLVVNNPNTIAVTGVAVTDNYPSGLENAPSPSATSTCGGSFVATPGAGTFSFSGGSIAASGSCTLQVSVTSSSAASYLNTIAIGGVTSAENIRNAVAATATLLSRPTIVKSFSPSAVQQNINATLTLAVTNPNATQALSNVALTDTFPTNLVATGGAVTVTGGATCTGFPATIAANAVSSTISGAGIGAGVTCSVSFAVRSAIAGPYPNTTTGATSTETPTVGAPSNTATLGVGLIGIAKSFLPAIVAQGQASTVTLTLTNPTGVTQTNASFSDSLANMQVNVNQTVTVTGAGCAGLTPTSLTAGQTALSFSGLTVPAAGCALTFTVNSVQVGTNPNTTSGVATALLPVGPPSNTANLTVVTKPTISKAFSPAAIQAGGVSTMVLTIDNQSSIPLTGINFTDSYPANVVNATPLTVGGSCTGVTTSATAGGNTFNVTAGVLPPSATCTITVNVTSGVVGSYNNTTSGIATVETGAAGAASNTAILSVVSPATITKSFGTTTIAQGGTSLITFTLQNANGATLTNATFTDALLNMSVAGIGTVVAGGTCAGATGNTFTAGQAGTLTFSGLTLASGSSCTVTLPVMSSSPGANPNNTSGVSSTQTPTPGVVSNTAVLNVLRAPNVSKAFSPAIVAQGLTSTLTFTISNPNTTALTNATFNDPLPNITLSASGFSSTCSGAVTFTPVLTVGGGNVNPNIATLAPNETCSISVSVTSNTISPAPGHVNTTSAPISTETSVVGGAVGVANLIVLARPTITKTFSPATVQVNGTSTITFTLTNPNAIALTGAAFSDIFPTNMTTTAVAQNYIGVGRGTCTGAIPSAGAAAAVGSRSFAGINIPANGSCTVMVDVRATVGGVYNNIVSGVTTAQTPTAGTGSTAVLTVLASPTVAKAFSPSTITNGAADFSTLTLTLTNPTSSALTGVAITDTYPSVNLINVTPTVTSNTCGGTLTATAGASALTLAGGSIAANSSCAITVRVRSGTAAAYVNVTSGVTSTETPTAGPTATDTLNVVAAGTNRLIYTKSFSQAQVVTGTSLNMVFTIQNLSAGTAAQTVSLNANDTMPTVGGQQMTLNSATNACTISASAPANSCGFNGATAIGTIVPNSAALTTALNFSLTGTGLTLAANSTCTLTCPVTVPATSTGGNYVNTATFLVTGTAGFTTTAGDSATVNAIARPSIAKAFSPTDIGIGGTSTVTLTITNAATNTVALSGASFTDTLTGMSVAATGPAGGTCAGAGGNTFTAGQTGLLTFSGLTIPASPGSCTVTFVVTGSTASAGLPNSTSGVSATGPIALSAGTVSNTANLAVRQASLNKAFAPTTIDQGGTSVLTFTLTNGTNNPAQTGIAFTDTLPANLVVANPAGVGGTCPNVTATALPGSGVITVSNADMTLAQATCTITVNVTSNVPGGPYNNTNASITGLARVTNSVTTSGVTVQALPSLTKLFSTSAIANGANATLTFNIVNTGTNNAARTDVGFVDTLPAGLTYSGAAAGTCTSTVGAALARAVSGGSNEVLTVSGVDLTVGATCTVTITVTNRAGQFGTCPDANFTNGSPNVTVTGLVNNVTNQCLSASRPVLTKAFAPTSVQTATNSVLSFVLTNGGGLPSVTAINFTDTLPTGLTVAGVPGVTTNCPAGGAFAAPGFTVTVAPTTAITVTGASINASVAACEIRVNVASAAPGTYVNDPTRITGATANIDAGGANATLTVFSVPITTKSFTPSTIAADGTTTMQFTVTNNNTVPLTGGSFSDTLVNIRVSGAQSAGGTCGGVTGNSFTDQQTGLLNFTGLTFPSGTCTITLLVTSDTPGTQTNTTSTVSVSGPLAMTGAASNTANLVVVAASPSISKAFAPTTIDADNISTSTITFQLSNTNSIALTAASFTDTLANMAISTNQTAAGTCVGVAGNTFTNNQTALTFSGLTIPPNASCTVTVTVKSNVAGAQPNTTSGVSSSQAATGAVSNTATLTVRPIVTLTKALPTPTTTVGVGQNALLTFSLANTTAGAVARTAVSFTDLFPTNMVVGTPNGLTTTGCGATPSVAAAPGAVNIVAGGIDINAAATCVITVNVTANTVGSYVNGAAQITATSANLVNGVTNQTLTVLAAPTISKAFVAGNIALNGTTTLNITVTNPNAGTALSGLNFTDTLPAGLTAVNGTTPVCGGSLVVTGANLLTFTGGTLAASANCVIGVTVTGTTAGAKNNTTAAVGATGPVVLTGTVSNTATVNVYTPPTLTKAFGGAIDTGNSATLTFTFANPAANPGTVSGIAVNDTFPTAPGAMTLFNGVVGGTCTATVLNQSAGAPVAGNTGLQISGISLNAGASCTVIVNVTANTAGSYSNTTTAVTATTPVVLSGATANDTLSVQLRPVLTKTFTAANIGVGQTTTLTFTIDNSAGNTINRAGLGFTDTLPGTGALTAVATTPQCGGVTVGVSGANNNIITVSGGAVNAGLSCTITATVTGVTPGSYINGPTNTSISGVSTNLTNSVADQSLNVRQATVAKTFGNASINDGATTTLIFTLTNGTGNPAQSGIALGDTLPTGLRFNSSTPAVTYGAGCSGPGAAAYDSMTRILSGISGVAMTGGTASCTVTVAGLTNTATQTNASCALSPALFTNLATNVTTTRATNTSTDQCLVVAQVNPTLTKAWSTASIADGAATNLVFTLTNAGTNPAQSGISFTESLPASLRFNSATPTVTYGAGCSGSSTVTQGAPDTIALSAVTMSALTASCTITVAGVTNRVGLLNTNCGASPAAFTNGSSNILPVAGVVNGVASQCLVVNSTPPVLTKAWGAASIVDGNSTTLVFTLANTGTNPVQSGIAFTESLPSGLRFTGAAPGVAFGAGCSGSSTVTQGAPDTIALSAVAMTNGTVNCTITVTGVTNRAGQVNASCGASPAAFTNGSGNITLPTNVTNSVTSQCLAVTTQVPTITKAFSPATISAGAPSTITLTITNPNSVALTSAAFTDTLANMRISGAQNAAGTCVGAATNAFANNQTGSLSFSGLTIPAGSVSCTVTVVVTSGTPGMLPNATSGVSSAGAATGAVSNTATLTVNAAAPTIVKSFATPSIALGGTSQIDFTITNPNATPLTGAAFSDTLANMFIHATGAATGSCTGAGTNNFTINQTGLLNVTGLTIPASGSCTVSIVVRSNTPGTLPNFATGVSSNEAPVGVSSATVNLTVTAVAPTITKTFLTNPIASGASSTLQITISNANAGPITVTTVTDTFPTTPGVGVVRAATPNAATSCASGVVASNATSVTLTGGTVPAGGSCTFQIDVTAATAGMYANTIAIGALTTNAGSNTVAANATLNVTAVANVSVIKSAPATIAWGTTITYTAVVSNAGPDAANLTVFSDNVPAAVTAVGAVCGTPTGGAVCGSVNVAGNSVTSTVTTLPSGGSVTFTITGTAPQSGTLSNFATAIVPAGISDPDDPTRIAAGNNTSATVMTVVQAPDLRITKTASSASLTVGINAGFTLTPSNTGSLATSGTVTVIDTLPSGLTYVAAGSGGTGWTCTPGGQVITCTSSTVIAAGGSGNTITINVQVLSNASPGITNSANISGGNEPAVNTGNNSAVLSLPVGTSAINTFSTDGALTGLPGASVLYAHTFNAGLSGTVSFAGIHTPSPNIIGWTVQIYRDNNCNAMMDGVDGVTEITGSGIAVTAGQQVCIIVKSNIPASASLGALDIISVTASFTPAVGPVVTYTRVDVTTVGAAQGAGLALSKSVRNVTLGGAAGTANTARPGDVLEYAIRYSNSSNSSLSTIALADVTPAFTTFVSATCVMPLPNNITSCTATTAPSVGAAGSIQWTVTGALLPGQAGTVQFRVTVQ